MFLRKLTEYKVTIKVAKILGKIRKYVMPFKNLEIICGLQDLERYLNSGKSRRQIEELVIKSGKLFARMGTKAAYCRKKVWCLRTSLPHNLSQLTNIPYLTEDKLCYSAVP
jgi:hypothetical protein